MDARGMLERTKEPGWWPEQRSPREGGLAAVIRTVNWPVLLSYPTWVT